MKKKKMESKKLNHKVECGGGASQDICRARGSAVVRNQDRQSITRTFKRLNNFILITSGSQGNIQLLAHVVVP